MTEPTVTASETPIGDEVAEDTRSRSLFIVTMSDDPELFPSDALDLDRSTFARTVVVQTPADLDEIEGGDHVTYAVDWRDVVAPSAVVEAVLDHVRRVGPGPNRITYSIV